MLGFFGCDAGVEQSRWREMVRRAGGVVNAITVDGDTNTNDTVLAFAAGEAWRKISSMRWRMD